MFEKILKLKQEEQDKLNEQAGAELGQAQLKLGTGTLLYFIWDFEL